MSVAAADRWGRLLTWAEGQSEHLNTILIRELRRALNGRMFVFTFLILLGLCVLVCVASMYTAGDDKTDGWNVFAMLLGCLCSVCYLGLPILITGMIGTEIRERTFELLSITTLTAARIIWGELMTAAGIFILFASAVAPFMAFSYLLGGLDLRTIGTGLALAFFVSMMLTMLVLVGAVQRPAETATRLGGVLAGLMVLGSTIGMVNGFNRPLETMWNEPDFYFTLGGFFLSYVTFGAILFAAAVSRLTFASANRSGPIRMTVVVHLASLGLYLKFSPGGFFGPGLAGAWSLYAMGVLFILGIMVMGEEETLSRRMVRTGRVRSRLPTLWAFFLPGADRGLALVLGAGLLVCTIAHLLLSGITLGHTQRWAHWVAYAYMVFYLGAGRFICVILPSLFQSATLRRLMPLILFVVTLLIPSMAAIIKGVQVVSAPFLAALSPVYFIPLILDNRVFEFELESMAATFSILALGGLSLLSLVRLLATGIFQGAAALRAKAKGA